MLYRWEGVFTAERDGQLNALRFITKNILAVVPERNSTIDWLNHYMTLPLAEPVALRAGESVQLGFAYRAGGQIQSLQATMRAVPLRQAATLPAFAA
jgi:hypothetical protein